MNIALFPGMSHAQAQQVCKEIGARVAQDGRGNLRLVPEVNRCQFCGSNECGPMRCRFTMMPTGPEAA